MKNKWIVVFDLDDTLYKEIDFLQSAYCEIATVIETKFSKQEVLSFMMKSYQQKQDVFQEVINFYGLTIEKQELLHIYRTHRPKISLAKEARTTLETLQNRGCILGLLTDGRKTTQSNKIEALGLHNFINQENIIISEEFGSEKPTMRNYEYFMQHYPDKRYCYIGDNIRKDFVTPNILGWDTVCLLDDGRNIHHQELTIEKQFLPIHLIKSFEELLTIIA